MGLVSAQEQYYDFSNSEHSFKWSYLGLDIKLSKLLLRTPRLRIIITRVDPHFHLRIQSGVDLACRIETMNGERHCVVVGGDASFGDGGRMASAGGGESGGSMSVVDVSHDTMGVADERNYPAAAPSYTPCVYQRNIGRGDQAGNAHLALLVLGHDQRG